MTDVRTTTHFVHHLERDDGRQTTIALIEHYAIVPGGGGFRTEKFTLEVIDQARDFSDEKPAQSIPLSLDLDGSVSSLLNGHVTGLIAERDAAVARAEAAESWLDELAQAAGMGPVPIVAAHQRELGVEGDHEPRLRAKQVRRLKAIVMEEAEWRRQVLSETQARAEAAEQTLQRVRAVLAGHSSLIAVDELRRALDGTP